MSADHSANIVGWLLHIPCMSVPCVHQEQGTCPQMYQSWNVWETVSMSVHATLSKGQSQCSSQYGYLNLLINQGETIRCKLLNVKCKNSVQPAIFWEITSQAGLVANNSDQQERRAENHQLLTTSKQPKNIWKPTTTQARKKSQKPNNF